MAETVVREQNTLKDNVVKWGIVLILLIVAFLAGFVPMWMKASDYAAQNETTQKSLTRSETSNLIAKAVVDARRGEYESARQTMSDFYTKLNGEIEKGENGAYPTAQADKLKQVSSDRDAIITLLAQRDSASVERLIDVYLNYRQAVGETITKTAVTPAAANTNSNSAVNSQ